MIGMEATLSATATTKRRLSRTRSRSSSSKGRALRGSEIVYPMSRRVPSSASGRTTAGSYSISACSCVRLTLTLSTPAWRPRAFSMVPVQSEQCSPPMRARMRARSDRLAGSSLHRGAPAASDVADDMDAPSAGVRRDDVVTGLLDRDRQTIQVGRFRVVEDAG